MRILVVEDSVQLRASLTAALEESGYAVDSTGNGLEGLQLAEAHRYDAVILDIMVPGLDGLAVLQRLRSRGDDTKVMFLTAKDTVEDRVHGLQTGADDYLVKPFALEELLARVQAMTRRAYGKADPVLRVADLEMDTVARTVKRGGVKIELAAREYALLEYLMLRAGGVVSRSEIASHLYNGFSAPMSNAVEAAVYALRKGLAISREAKPLIHTKRGLGYVLEERDA